ncbi:MAG: hypothetical protein PHI91_00270 [Candidatus Pacebacteria bacterium]|nr:hypothetical protein [Candidatus Paceibacterota bacterium]MDD2757014.1 hypothetical protein [Candidatus Paceibacterota bacterium]MDD3969620.1 hypothetical protein [Candidatus Paceibacterota bacterium]MDD4737834.1 hypothetical protein [Candidatus Paceibacterota bacterium]
MNSLKKELSNKNAERVKEILSSLDYEPKLKIETCNIPIRKIDHTYWWQIS